MKIGQPKLSEGPKEVGSGMFVTPTICNGDMICEVVITEGNKQKRQGRVDPALLLDNRMTNHHLLDFWSVINTNKKRQNPIPIFPLITLF
jgi:hypothetical protein